MGNIKERLTNWYEKQDAPVKVAVEKVGEIGNLFKDLFIPKNTEDALYYTPIIGDAKAGANVLDSGIEDIKAKNYLSGSGKIALAPILTLGTMLTPDGFDGPLKIITGTKGRPNRATIIDNAGVKRELTRDDLINAVLQHNLVTDETKKLSKTVIDESNRKAGYDALMQKLIRKEDAAVKLHPDIYQRKRANYAPRKKAQIYGDLSNPLLTKTINIKEVFEYNPRKSLESNYNRFKEEMLQEFHFTQKDLDEVFNYNLENNLFEQGGKFNYLNIFK